MDLYDYYINLDVNEIHALDLRNEMKVYDPGTF